MTVCPNCGDFQEEELEEVTGWCPECSGHKRCLRCEVMRAPEAFPPDRRTVDGRRNVCKPCRRSDDRARRGDRLEEAREAEREKSRRYRVTHIRRVAA